MVVGLLGNKSPDSNRLTLVTPKSENDVRLQAKLGNQNPTGLPVGVVSSGSDIPCNKLVHITRLQRRFSVQKGRRISFRMGKLPYVTNVTYHVSKPGIAKVSKKGVLTGISPGKARLSMTFWFEDGTKSRVRFDVNVVK